MLSRVLYYSLICVCLYVFVSVCVCLCVSVQNPPGLVKLVMEAVCIMLSIKPERKPEPGTGRMFDDYWGPSVKLLGDMKFLDKLKTYEKDNIPPMTIKRIREKYVTLTSF